jgi:hypothetical protein
MCLQPWPHQLYIRITRRLAGRYTVSANDVYNRTQIEDPICLAQYGIDVYPCRRIWIEKAGIAACRALAENASVQGIDLKAYREALSKANMLLEWKETDAAGPWSDVAGARLIVAFLPAWRWPRAYTLVPDSSRLRRPPGTEPA